MTPELTALSATRMARRHAHRASLPLVGRDGVGGIARVGQYTPSPIPSPRGGGVPPLTPPKD